MTVTILIAALGAVLLLCLWLVQIKRGVKKLKATLAETQTDLELKTQWFKQEQSENEVLRRRIDAALSHTTPKMAYVGKKMARELKGQAEYSVKA